MIGTTAIEIRKMIFPDTTENMEEKWDLVNYPPPPPHFDFQKFNFGGHVFNSLKQFSENIFIFKSF